jgi:hypothetical protein
MKQILTYVSPQHEFNDEHKMAVKIQIDNSLSLGWKPEDIILATNFPYEYNGVKSTIVADECYCESHWPATKIRTVIELFKKGVIKSEELYWYHDFDCFQLNPMREPEIADMGVTNYGRMPRLCSASIFFKIGASDIFYRLFAEVKFGNVDEERGLARLINRLDEYKERVTHLNITYAFHKFNVVSCYNLADKPLIAAHFHLTPDKYDFYVRGNNKLEMPLIPKRLINIFHKHGFDK